MPVGAARAVPAEVLRGMQGSGAMPPGLIIGGMMAFGMGGPVDMAGGACPAGLLAGPVYGPAAAAMAAGMMTPPGMAPAVLLFRDRFTPEGR